MFSRSTETPKLESEDRKSNEWSRSLPVSQTKSNDPSPKRCNRRIGYGSTNFNRNNMPIITRMSLAASDRSGIHSADENNSNNSSLDITAQSVRGESGCRRRNTPPNKNCVVFIVFLALFLDCLLLTAMVPIIPNFLREHEQRGLQPPQNTSSPAHDPLPSLYHAGEKDAGRDKKAHGISYSRFYRPHEVHNKSEITQTNENTRISLLFASKTLVQVAFNMFVGPLTERIGYSAPMFTGFIVLLLSTIAFALGNTYEVLFAARAFQGLGTALSTTSGMGLLASIFTDQTERAVAQTKAFSGLALGVFLGPPFGGILYDLFGRKEFPCLIMACLVLFEGVLQMCVMRPKIERQTIVGSSLFTLLRDPYIMITAATIAVSNMCTAVLEPALPIWMYYTMHAPTWLQGVAFVPSTVSYLLFLQVFGCLAVRFGCFKVSQRWVHTIIGMIVLAISTALVPYCSNFYLLIGPLLLMGFGLAQTCTCMLPHIGALVDMRHEPVYGSAYAITDNAFSIAFAAGPAISGPLIDLFGFTWTVRGVSLLILSFTPFVLFLRNPPVRRTLEEQQSLLLTSSSNGRIPDVREDDDDDDDDDDDASNMKTSPA